MTQDASAKPATPPTPEQMAALNVRLSATFGQIVSILMRTPQHLQA
jgi:hypothetical protein